MTRFIAFLRAINVGGHTVRMNRLVELFEAMGHSDVETYIASGNVVFGARSRDAARLERVIEERLAAGLGYEVATFLRTEAELAAVARARPLPAAELEAVKAWNVIFLGAPLTAADRRKVLALESDVDRFKVEGREIHWLCRLKRSSESEFSNRVLEKTLGRPSTIRVIRTIREMAMRYTDAAS